MKTAIIFAAGRGRRLRPMTDTMPKSLCSIHGKPLIDYHLEKLVSAGFSRVLVNHAYLGDQIRRHIQQKELSALEVIYLPEPPGGLRTGGTLQNASAYVDNTPLFAINADIFTDYDLSKLACPKGSLAHLVLVKTPDTHQTADFGLDAHQKLSDQDKQYTFSGIAVYQPAFLKEKSEKRAALAPWLKDASKKGQVTGEVHPGLWFDIGTPERLKAAEAATQSA